MKTPELEKILATILPKEKVNFLGVFARDEISTVINNYPACFVANTDPSSEPGTHWVAFYLESPTKSEFFDSYGLHPIAYGFTHQVTSYNHTQFQTIHSTVCGHYCILFLYSRSLCSCVIDTLFSKTNLDWNDKQVTKWVRSLSQSKTPFIPCTTSRCIQCCTCKNK